MVTFDLLCAVWCIILFIYFTEEKFSLIPKSGDEPEVTLVTNVVLQDTPLRQKYFRHVPVVFNTFNDVLQKLQDGRIHPTGRVVVLVLGNTKIIKLPGIARANAFGNLIEKGIPRT